MSPHHLHGEQPNRAEEPSSKAYGLGMVCAWHSARHRVGFKTLAVAMLTAGLALSVQPASAEAPQCPASFASGDEKLACIQDDGCSLGKKWPAEMKRLRWVSREAEAFIEDRLSNVSECVLVGDLQARFDTHITECRRGEAETAIVLAATRMLNRDRLVSNRRGVGKKTRVGLPKLGDCY